MIELHKYSGAGNDFVVLDGRKEDVSEFRTPERIAALCDRRTGFAAADGRIGADGLMILTDDPDYDFRMEYYNSDGSGGMMCGNGGRCIVAFSASPPQTASIRARSSPARAISRRCACG